MTKQQRSPSMTSLSYRSCRGVQESINDVIILSLMSRCTGVHQWRHYLIAHVEVYAMCTLCHKVCQWLAAGRWFSLGSPVSSTNKTWPPRYKWNIIENGVNHHNPNSKLSEYLISLQKLYWTPIWVKLTF